MHVPVQWFTPNVTSGKISPVRRPPIYRKFTQKCDRYYNRALREISWSVAISRGEAGEGKDTGSPWGEATGFKPIPNPKPFPLPQTLSNLPLNPEPCDRTLDLMDSAASRGSIHTLAVSLCSAASLSSASRRARSRCPISPSRLSCTQI